MSLVEYRRKRRFDRTKEPEPGPALPAGQRAISPRRNMGVAMSRSLTSVGTACSSGGRACRRALLAPAGQARRRAPEGRAVGSWDQMGWLSHWRVGRRTSEDRHASTIH